MHPHSLYPYLTLSPPVSLLLLFLVLLAHCVSRMPSLSVRALTHTSSFLLPSSRCMKYESNIHKQTVLARYLFSFGLFFFFLRLDSHYQAVISDNNWAFSFQFTVALPPRPVEARCLPPLRCVTVRHVGITIPTGFMPRDDAGLV